LRLIFTENMHSLTLPAGHRFPIGKYDKIHARLAAKYPWAMQLGAPAETSDLLLVHDADYVASVKEGTMSAVAVRRLGFPWSPMLVLRSMRSVGGTLSALAWAMQEGAAGHIAGGTHHAFADRGEGFCVFNDIAVAVMSARRDYRVRRVAVIDLDVHQGNGTAAIFASDPDVLTVSLHGAKNYPFKKETSALDVALPDGVGDADYLAALAPALERVETFRPELVFFQAGVDVLAGDRLGRMGLSPAGVHARNRAVYSLVRRLGVPLVVTLGGGYHRDLDQSVDAHAGVYEDLVEAMVGSYK
jgi:acetoin utilization deacetylase AcuC-like enzyme